MRTDMGNMLQLFLMPLLMMAVLAPLFRTSLVATGHPGANGAEQAVPGMAVMFAFFLVGFVGFAFFREHGWGTWERLRASGANPLEIMVGKVLPSIAMAMVQQLLLFGLGGWLFGLHVRGNVLLLPLIIVSYSMLLVAIGVLLAAMCRTAQQVNVISSTGAMFVSGLGGAFVPLAVLPSWARAVAPFMPPYWAMRAFRAVILDGAGLSTIALPLVVLVGGAIAITAAGVVRFRFEETKVAFG